MSNNKQTVIITGASSGIGLGLTKAFLATGYNVVGNSRSEERLNAAARQFDADAAFLAVAGDIGEPTTAERLFSQAVRQFGQVDVLVNNAGIFNAKPIVEYSPQEIDDLVNTNLKGFAYATQQAVRHMTARKSGHIVSIATNIASGTA